MRYIFRAVHERGENDLFDKRQRTLTRAAYIFNKNKYLR